jgi:hypothetical protein
MKKQPNRCDVYVRVYLSNVPIGLESDQYWEYMEDDIADGALHITDHETAEAWYDKDHDELEVENDNR